MRVSIDQADPGYHPLASRCRVFLEGAARNNVITADEERRYALVHRLDEDGRVVEKDGNPVTEAFYGAVRIELPDGMDEAAFRQARSVWAPMLGSLGYRAQGDDVICWP